MDSKQAVSDLAQIVDKAEAAKEHLVEIPLEHLQEILRLSFLAMKAKESLLLTVPQPKQVVENAS